MPDPAENPVVSEAPKGAPPSDTVTDTTTAAGQRLLQSANGDKIGQVPTTDSVTASSKPETRTLWVSEFMSIAGDTRSPRPGQPSDSTVGAKSVQNAMPESIAKGFKDLEQVLKRNGIEGTNVEDVSKQFEVLQKQGKLPLDLSAIKACLDRLNRDGKSDKLTAESTDTILRLVSASLKGKVQLLTPESAPSVAERSVYNRENPDYEKGDTNCRACTGSFIINERLSDRAMLLEFDKLLDHVEAGKTKLLLIPLENGIPKMTADAFEVNYGQTHSGTPGIVYTAREQKAFQDANPKVPDYVRDSLKKAGFSDLTLTGGATPTSLDASKAMRRTGFYVLEHPTGGGTVDGHVTAAYVDNTGKIHRIDTQIPDNRNAQWPISTVHEVTTGNIAVEEKSSRINPLKTDQSESTTRVFNPDGTVRDFNISKPNGELLSFTDVDGRSYFRNSQGKWQTMKQGTAVDAPFKRVEYLGTTDGTRFSFENHTVTEKPNGTAEIAVPDRVVINDGVTLKINNTDIKVSDLVSQITRNPDGSVSVKFKDNTIRNLPPETATASASDTRNLKQLETQLQRLDGSPTSANSTTSGDSLNRVVMGRIQEEVAKGASRESAALTVLTPNASSSDLERMSGRAEAMKQVGLPTDPATIARVNTVLETLKTEDINTAKSVLDKAQVLLNKSKDTPTQLTEKQALEISMVQHTPNPATPGKNYTEASAKALLKKVAQVRGDTYSPDLPLSNALEVLRLKDQYSGWVIESFSRSPRGSLNQLDKGYETRNLNILAKDPKALAQTEALYKKLGGSASGITLMDASVINANPRLRDNPDFALEIYNEARTVRSKLLVPDSKYKFSEYLEMGLLVHDHEGRGGSSLKGHQIEEAYARSKVEAARAADNQRSTQSETTAHEKTTVEKPIADTTTNDTRAEPGKTAQPPIEASRVESFRSKLSSLDTLPTNQMYDEYLRTALRETAGSVSSKRHRPAFANSPANVVESESLQPGESKLAITHGGKSIEVKSIDSGGTLAYITADGTKVPVHECQVSMQCGKGSSKAQIAREALVRSIELRDLFDGKANDAALGSTRDQLVKAAFESHAVTERAGLGVAEQVAKLGEFPLEGGRQPVVLTETGVRFGGKPEVTFKTLVEEALKDKRQQLERLKENKDGTNPERDGQIKILNDQILDLDHLSKNVHRPETMAKLIETIKKHTAEEVERLRSEKSGAGRAQGAITRAGTYSLVAVFVARMIYQQSGSPDAGPRYAPSSF